MHSRVSELVEAEAVLLTALRRWIVGSRGQDPRLWSLAWNDLAMAFGTEPGREALNALIAMVRAICNGARRTIEYHQPCCPCVCADEICILAIVGACQRGEADTAEGLAQWLVLPECAPDLMAAAGTLAEVLAAQGHRLPSRRDFGRRRVYEIPKARPLEATLH